MSRARLPLTVLWLLAIVPLVVAFVVHLPVARDGPRFGSRHADMLRFLALLEVKVVLLDPLAAALVAPLVLERLQGREISLRACLALFGYRAWRSLAAHALALSPLLFLMAVSFIGSKSGSRIIALLLSPMMVVPLAIIGITWLAPVVALVEGRGPWPTLRRTMSLASRHGALLPLVGACAVVLEGLPAWTLVLGSMRLARNPGRWIAWLPIAIATTAIVSTTIAVTYHEMARQND